MFEGGGEAGAGEDGGVVAGFAGEEDDGGVGGDVGVAVDEDLDGDWWRGGGEGAEAGG